MIFTHRPRVSFAPVLFCRRHDNWLLVMSQWPDNCGAITWIVIFNSLDIDFIHSDIHGIVIPWIYEYNRARLRESSHLCQLLTVAACVVVLWNIQYKHLVLLSAYIPVPLHHIRQQNYSMAQINSYNKRIITGNTSDFTSLQFCFVPSHYIHCYPYVFSNNKITIQKENDYSGTQGSGCTVIIRWFSHVRWYTIVRKFCWCTIVTLMRLVMSLRTLCVLC